MKSAHYFIGIPVEDEEIKAFLVRHQKWLERSMGYKVWTHPEDFHVTLRFLGEVENLTEWKRRVEEAKNLHSFSLVLKGCASFGHASTPRVVYESVTFPPGLRRVFDHFQEEPDLPFTPHITLAKKWRSGTLPPIVAGEEVEWKITGCSLFKIHPGREPKYEKLLTGVFQR